MPLHFFWKFPGLLLLAVLLLTGCSVTSQDQRRGPRELTGEMGTLYQSDLNFGYSSRDSDQWNTTDWQRWLELQGGGG